MTRKALSWPLTTVAMVAAVALFAGVSVFALSHSATARYRDCVRDAGSDSARALDTAKVWLERNPASPLARHCQALALFAEKNYAESAALLSTLATETQASNPRLSAKLRSQAIAAFEAGGDYGEARKLLDTALTQNSGKEEKSALLAERAHAFLGLDDRAHAMTDLKAALALTPDNTALSSLLTDINKESFPSLSRPIKRP